MSSAQDFSCVFCSETFEDKESLQEHFRKHGDPKFNSNSKNKARFQNELPGGSEKSEEGELVGCDVCDEMFKSISKAITHKHKVHPDHDAKYFCPWCGKLFTMKHLYNKHMEANHTDMSMTEQSTYHCDCCCVDFFVPSAMVYHNRFFHRQDTELPAIGNSKKVTTFNQELIQIYYCPFCGEEYNNKVNLHKHMSDDHSDENQRPDEVLRCPLCEAVFYHLDAYELHLSFHSSDDIYSDDTEIPMSITEFSLESVPPCMEKVEEETKQPDTEGIDKFLQLVMDESRENGNNDGLDKPKSKKHKKHKKSKKAAITFDEFLNMNKDVFGDGLDVQGIEEVPTQQVLKKCKRKNDTAKPIPASAIAKLKKQGITIKSNSGSSPAIIKTNRNLVNNRIKTVPNIPMKTSDKHTVVTSSNDLLTKLLNQGNSQIKVVKKSTTENVNKDKSDDQTDLEEPTTSNIKKPLSNKNLSLQENDADEEVKNGNKNDEMEQDSSDVLANDSLNSKDLINDTYRTNDIDMEHSASASQENISATVNHEEKEPLNHVEDDENDTNSENAGPSDSESLDSLQRSNNGTDVNDQEHSFENNEDDIETDARDNSVITNITKSKVSNNLTEENYNNFQKPTNRSLDALKHLSGVITIKPGHSIEEKNDVIEKSQLNMQRENEELIKNMPLQVTTNLGKNIQNACLKKPYSPQNNLDTPTKSLDALKILNKQLTIAPCVSSTTKSNDESEDDEHDDYNPRDKINTPSKNINNDKDNVNFKTPMSVSKQHNTTAILKRLTNVTAKPIAKPVPQENDNQPVNSKMPVIPNFVKKQIDQNIEIFNIDDSDSDQEFPTEEYGDQQVVNTPSNNKPKAIPADNVFKNLSKNITIKPTLLSVPTLNKKPLNIKNEVTSEKSKPISDQNMQNPTSNENKIYSQNKHMNINKNLNQTLKKLGNNISIKSQYSKPNLHKYQMLHDEHIDDNFDTNDEESDSEGNNPLKIAELQEDDENLPSDNDMEHDENVIVQSPHASNSENEEEISNYQSSDEKNDDIETQIKTNTLSKETSASQCLDNFKRNNRELTIRSLNDKNGIKPQTASPSKKQEEATHVTNKFSKDMSKKTIRAAEKKDDREISSKNINEVAATSSSNQKVTNQVNTVKTVKTFKSETIIEEITTTVTKTIRTVNQSSNQVAQNASTSTYRPRIIVSNQQAKPLKGMTVRNAQSVGTRIRNAAPSPRPTTIVPPKNAGQLASVRSQNQISPRMQGIHKPNMPGTSNIRSVSPQQSNQKPVIGKPLRISPLAMNQTVKRAPERLVGPVNIKRSKESMAPSVDTSEDDYGDSVVNYSSASSSRSDFSTTATKMVKGKSVITTTQARSEQHSEQHISKLSNMAGLKIVRTSAKQASQVETRNDMSAAKRTTMDAIEKLKKQGLLVKKPRIEAPEEDEHYNSDSEEYEEEYEENDE